jgi:hypothetical protein
VLVGVDNSGVPSKRLGELKVSDFDPANLYRIAHSYLPTIQVRAATHDIDGITVAIIYIGSPDPPGVAILVKDGQYADGNKTKTVCSGRHLPGPIAVATRLPRPASGWRQLVRGHSGTPAPAVGRALVERTTAGNVT